MKGKGGARTIAWLLTIAAIAVVATGSSTADESAQITVRRDYVRRPKAVAA